MSLLAAETADLIAELTKRMGPAAYRANRHQFDALSFRIGVEQQEAELTKKGKSL